MRRLAGAEGFAAAWEAALDHGVARLEDCALALALEGEELPIVSAGKLLGTFRKHNFGFMRFLLAQRRGARFSEGSAGRAALVPGHPVYDRLKAEWDEAARVAKEATYLEDKQAIHRRLLEIQARHWEYFKRELRRRGAEDILAAPNAEDQIAALAHGELPPGMESL